MEQDAKKQDSSTPGPQVQDEFDQRPAWKHPYFAYLLITVLLFAFLLLMSHLAIENDWLPNRGSVQPH